MNDDAEQFNHFAARAGSGALVQAFRCFTVGQPTASLPDFLHSEDLAKPHVQKLLGAMDHPGKVSKGRVLYQAYSRHSPEDRFEWIRLYQEILALETDTTSVEKQAETARHLIVRAKPYPDLPALSTLYARYAGLQAHLGHGSEVPFWFQAGVEAALVRGDTTMACQNLGSLGAFHAQRGEFEAMRPCYDRALALAELSGNWQQLRILSFYQIFYASQGQIAMARDLALEVLDRSRWFEPQMGLRFAIDTLQFFAGLQCWDEVERGLRRTEMVFEECRSQLPPDAVETQENRLLVLRARSLAATGRCGEALKLTREVVKRLDKRPHAYVRQGTARIFASCGATPEVRTIMEQGFEKCIKEGVRGAIDGYAIELAHVYLELGDLDACQRTLHTYPPRVNTLDSVRDGILQLRVALLRQDRPGAFVRLKIALDLLEAIERQAGASPEAYIAVATADELRRLGHDMLDGSAVARYAFEMQWRRPLGVGPRFNESVASELTWVSSLTSDAERMRRQLEARAALHCVYDVRGDRVVRLTADGSGVQLDRLACSPGELETLVDRVCASLARPSPPTNSLDARQTEDLRQLATWLLPDSLSKSSGYRLLLVTANGFLSRLRFETLNIGTQGYLPLLDRVDVASMRHWLEAGKPGGDSTLVVSNPIYSANLRRHYSILTETLPASVGEAATARRLLPRTIGLSGPAATQQNIVQHLPRARVVYFAGHVIQDTDLPYVMFIPVSESPGGDEHDSYLEVADVRNADLSGSQLVVLSSCASGAPYLDVKVEVPSLGDVFLDAGARAVVSTGWAVRDDDAARIMTSFLHLYAATPNDPVTALCRARRAVAAITNDPHIWAAYSITLGALSPTEVSPPSPILSTRE